MITVLSVLRVAYSTPGMFRALSAASARIATATKLAPMVWRREDDLIK